MSRRLQAASALALVIISASLVFYGVAGSGTAWIFGVAVIGHVTGTSMLLRLLGPARYVALALLLTAILSGAAMAGMNHRFTGFEYWTMLLFAWPAFAVLLLAPRLGLYGSFTTEVFFWIGAFAVEFLYVWLLTIVAARVLRVRPGRGSSVSAASLLRKMPFAVYTLFLAYVTSYVIVDFASKSEPGLIAGWFLHMAAAPWIYLVHPLTQRLPTLPVWGFLAISGIGIAVNLWLLYLLGWATLESSQPESPSPDEPPAQAVRPAAQFEWSALMVTIAICVAADIFVLILAAYWTGNLTSGLALLLFAGPLTLLLAWPVYAYLRRYLA